MKFTANNPDRIFLTIGEVNFTQENGVAHNIDINTLSAEALYQLCYNVFVSHQLLCEDPDALRSYWMQVAGVNADTPQVAVQAIIRPRESNDFTPVVVEQVLDHLLELPVVKFKKEINAMGLEDMRLLLDLESSRKNRKSVISLLKQKISTKELGSNKRFRLTYEEEVIEIQEGVEEAGAEEGVTASSL